MTDDQKRIKRLEDIIYAFVLSDRYSFQKLVEISGQRNLLFRNGSHIQLDTAVGTMIGTTTTEKLGFYGKTPTAQLDLPYPNPSATDIATVLVSLGLANPIT